MTSQQKKSGLKLDARKHKEAKSSTVGIHKSYRMCPRCNIITGINPGVSAHVYQPGAQSTFSYLEWSQAHGLEAVQVA